MCFTGLYPPLFMGEVGKLPESTRHLLAIFRHPFAIHSPSKSYFFHELAKIMRVIHSPSFRHPLAILTPSTRQLVCKLEL